MGSKTARAGAIGRRPVVPGVAAVRARRRHIARGAIGYPLLVKAVAGGGGKGMRGRASAGRSRRARSRWRDPRRARLSATTACISSGCSSARGTSKCSCSATARHDRAVRRARVFDSAPPSEADRGDAVAVRDAGAARAPDGGRGGDRASRRATRAPARSSSCVDADGRVLLPRDEHAASGRASRSPRRSRASISCGRKSRSRAEAGRRPQWGRRLADDRYVADPSAVRTATPSKCRVYAENPDAGFLPSPGTITHLRPPSGPGIRDDSGVFEGWTVPTAYDPLVSKVIAWAPDRPGAIARMVRALKEYDLRGIKHDDCVLPRPCSDRRHSPRRELRHDVCRSAARGERKRTRRASRARRDRGDGGGDAGAHRGRDEAPRASRRTARRTSPLRNVERSGRSARGWSALR